MIWIGCLARTEAMHDLLARLQQVRDNRLLFLWKMTGLINRPPFSGEGAFCSDFILTFMGKCSILYLVESSTKRRNL